LKFLDTIPDFTKNENLKNEFVKFGKDVRYHLSFDTFFKKQFHLPTGSTTRHKCILLLFFLYEYLIDIDDYEELIRTGHARTKFGEKTSGQDPRYEALIAGLLKPIPKKFDLTTHVNFITWNYDLNLLSAILNFLTDSDANIATFIKDNTNNNQIIAISDQIKVIPLNGLILHHGLNARGPLNKKELTDYFRRILNKYIDDSKSLEDDIKSIKFSWETLAEHDNMIENVDKITEAKNAISRSEIIIIIGYSFPLYNRLIDSALINKDSMFKKNVYIQDPQAEAIESTLRNDLGLGYPREYILGGDEPRNIYITPITNCKSFFVPSSLFFKPK
jgi:hypothetical protein